MIKSPLNYIGGKFRLLPQILPLFPQSISTFVDLFAGGCNVGINVLSQKIILNDNLSYLTDLYKFMQETPIENILSYIEKRISVLGLSQTNKTAYLELREIYNKDHAPLDLFLLTAFSFNHQIRFNNSHQFNTPFGKERSSFNFRMKNNLVNFVEVLQKNNVVISNISFERLDYTFLSNEDIVYCDPPYLITTGSYNDGKRGFKGWGINEEQQLLELLDKLDKRSISFALSNVLVHKGKQNEILKTWLSKRGYNIYDLHAHYGNSSYQTKNRDPSSSREVLITNY